jgi:hypothetical protein
VNTDWKDSTKDTDYEARKKVSVKAFESGCVICLNGKFYTPRAFLESDEKVTFMTSGTQEYSNCTLHYPRHAVERKLEDLRKAHKEFESFMQSLITAFELHPIKALKKKS